MICLDGEIGKTGDPMSGREGDALFFGSSKFKMTDVMSTFVFRTETSRCFEARIFIPFFIQKNLL